VVETLERKLPSDMKTYEDIERKEEYEISTPKILGAKVSILLCSKAGSEISEKLFTNRRLAGCGYYSSVWT
jgi:hypothetical protein